MAFLPSQAVKRFTFHEKKQIPLQVSTNLKTKYSKDSISNFEAVNKLQFLNEVQYSLPLNGNI